MPKFFAICLVLLLCQSLTACKETAVPAAVIRPAQVWQVTDQTATLDHAVSYSGEIKARYEADLAFRVAGKLMQRSVDSGDAVKAGQTLATLDTADLKLNIQAAQANVRAAISEQDTATAELDRNNALFEKNFLSKAAVETYVNRYNTAQANVKAAQAQLDIAQNQASYTALHSDKAGIITAVNAEAGQVVAAGQAIAHIAYNGEREVQIRVGESTAKTLANDTLVTVKLWSQADTTFQGRVREVSPSTDTTRSFLVRIRLINPPADLRLGVTADVSIPNTPTATEQPNRWIPATALFQQGQNAAVWIVQNNKVQLQPVTVVAYQTDGVNVSGLANGTTIIAAGIHKISAGQTINPVPYDGKAGS